MFYEFFVGGRYLLSRRKDRSISIITWISIGGVAVGVIALIVSTAIMNGFRDNLRKAIIGSLPHVTLFGWEADYDVKSLEEEVKKSPSVVAVAPYIYKQALISGKKRPKGALLRGIDPEREVNVTEIASFIRADTHSRVLTPEEQAKTAKMILKRLHFLTSSQAHQLPGIILGGNLAYTLDVNVGDTVKLISSEDRMTPVGDVPRAKTMEVVGIFESGISGYDDVLAFADYRVVQKLYNMGDQVGGLGVRIQNPEHSVEVARTLGSQEGYYLTGNWAEENRSIFQVMKIEKIALFLILTLIVLVAAFNIISSLIMLVLEKSKEIAILKSLGATDRSIRLIFMMQGVIIGTFGTLFGVAIGLSICWVLMTYDLIPIPPGVYPGGNRVPVSIHWPDVGATALAAFLICLFVTLYPATKAARLRPAQALRYE